MPAGATAVLGSYLKQGMRFFVAKVNLTEQAKLGFSYLRPLQMAFDTPKFMLPIRLGTLNADGAQELFVYALTRKGRVETTTTARCGCHRVRPRARQGGFPQFFARCSAKGRRRHARGIPEYAGDMGVRSVAANQLPPKSCGRLACSGSQRAVPTRCARRRSGRSRAVERVRDAASRAVRRRALPR